MPLRIRQWSRLCVGFEEELRSISPDDREKRIPLRLLKPSLEAEPVAVERDAAIDVADDKEWRDRQHVRTLHKR
jgi:hypothetical protein